MRTDKIKTAIAFFGIYIVWGTTFLAISIGVKGFPPFLLSGLRFLVAGALLFIYSVFKGDSYRSFVNWKNNAVIGLLVLTGGTGLLTWGEQYIPSTEACTIEAAAPFLFIAFDRSNWRYYFSKRSIIAGLLTGFTGVLLYLNGSLSNESSTGQALKTLAVGVLVLATICWVTGSLLAKKLTLSVSVGMNTAQQLLSAGAACMLIAMFRNEPKSLQIAEVTLSVWLSILYLIVFGSIIAYISYQYLLSTQNPALVSTHTYINPVVAMLAGRLLAGETVTGLQIAGMTVILGGVFLTNVSNYKFKKRPWYNPSSLRRWFIKGPGPDFESKKAFIRRYQTSPSSGVITGFGNKCFGEVLICIR